MFVMPISRFLWKHRSILVILVLIGALAWQWQTPDPLPGPRLPPYEAPLIQYIEKVRTEVKEIRVPVYLPTPKEVAKIEKEIGGKLPAGDLLGVHKVDPLPSGGKIVITQPAPESPLTVTVYPNAPKRFEWKLRDRNFSLWTDVDQFKPDLEIQQDLFRAHRLTVGLRVKQNDVLNQSFRPQLQIGARISF